MGVNTGIQNMSPYQQQALAQLVRTSTTPQGGGAAGGAAQLASALLGNQALQQWRQKWGVAPPGAGAGNPALNPQQPQPTQTVVPLPTNQQ